MADTGGEQNDIALLELITVRTHQILYMGAGMAVENLQISVAVQGYDLAGVGGIPMGIDELGGHLQFLIDIAGINADRAQQFMNFLLRLRRLGEFHGCQLPHIVKFHKIHFQYLEFLAYYITTLQDMQCFLLFLQFYLRSQFVKM